MTPRSLKCAIVLYLAVGLAWLRGLDWLADYYGLPGLVAVADPLFIGLSAAGLYGLLRQLPTRVSGLRPGRPIS